MSGAALRDLNAVSIPRLEIKNESSGKGNLIKTQICQTEHLENGVSNNELGSNGVENVIAEVEYIETENLPDLTSVDESLCV